MELNEAKKELKSYISMEVAIEQMQSWIEQKKQSSNKLTSIISSQPRGSPIFQDNMAEKLSNVLDIEAVIKEQIIKMKTKQKEILQKILKLEQPYQNVLFSIYIVGNTIDSSASIVGLSRAEIYRKKDKGIEMYAELI